MRAGVISVVALVAVLAGCNGNEKNDRTNDVVPSSTETAPEPSIQPTKPHAAARAETAKPPITQWHIPFPAARRRETAEYARRHYGVASTKLDPKVIVIHYSVTRTARAVYDTFARDAPDVELHELPGVCSHFVVDRDGTIFQLVPLTLVCRHTVGLNDVAIGIEHVGNSDAEVLGDRRQLDASLRLTAWLRCRYGIAIEDVIGHAESLSSRYHHENVPSLRKQTHSDFQPRSMDRYRRRLAAHGC